MTHGRHILSSIRSAGQDEFLHSALRLKGNARAIDSIMIMHEQHLSLKNVNKKTCVPCKNVYQRVSILFCKAFTHTIHFHIVRFVF